MNVIKKIGEKLWGAVKKLRDQRRSDRQTLAECWAMLDEIKRNLAIIQASQQKILGTLTAHTGGQP